MTYLPMRLAMTKAGASTPPGLYVSCGCSGFCGEVGRGAKVATSRRTPKKANNKETFTAIIDLYLPRETVRLTLKIVS